MPSGLAQILAPGHGNQRNTRATERLGPYVKHVKLTGLCLLAALAIAAIAASTASAVKAEWGQCVKVAKGKYTDANCTTKGKGEYEWKKGSTLPAKSFTGAGGEGRLISTLSECENSKGEVKRGGPCVDEFNRSEVEVDCTSENAKGEAHGTNLVGDVHVAFKECVALELFACSNTAEPGEIQVTPLKGELGFIDKTKNEVGVVLEPEGTKTFATFECGPLNLVVGEAEKKETSRYGTKLKETVIPAYPATKGGGDGIISPITPVNQMTNEFTQIYSQNAENENVPSKFEGAGKLKELEAYFWDPETEIEGRWEKAGQTIENVDQVEGEAVEIKG